MCLKLGDTQNSYSPGGNDDRPVDGMGCPFFRHTQISWMNVPIPCIPWFFPDISKVYDQSWMIVCEYQPFLNLCTQQFLSPSFLMIDAPTWRVKTCQWTSRLCVRWCPHVWASAIWTQWFLIDVRICNSFLSPFWLFPIPLFLMNTSILFYSEIPTCHGECQVVHCFNPNCSICFHGWLLLNDIPNVVFTMKPMDFPHVFHIFPHFSTMFIPPFDGFYMELTMLTTGVGASRAFRACQTGSPGGCREHSDARRIASDFRGMRQFRLWKIHHPEGHTRWWYR